MNYESTLSKITNIVQRYESGEYLTSDKLRDLQRELSTSIYHLTKENIEAYKRWNTLVYNSDKSNARATTEADYKVPELRITRKILDACKNVSISMTNEIKIIQNES